MPGPTVAGNRKRNRALRRQRRRKPASPSVPLTINATLGGEGVRKAAKARRSFDRSARRRVGGAAARTFLDLAGDRDLAIERPSNLSERLARLQSALNLQEAVLDPFQTPEQKRLERRLRQRIDATGRRLEAQESGGILESLEEALGNVVSKGIIGAPFEAITGNDISDDARGVIYGDETPSAGAIAGNVALSALPGAAGVVGRGGKAAAALAGGSRAGQAVRGAGSAVRGAGAAAAGGAAARAAAVFGGGSRGAQAARGVGRAAAGTAKVAGRTLTYPIRHPLKVGVKYPAMAQVPVAAFDDDPLQSFANLWENPGATFAGNIFSDVGEAVGNAVPGVAGNALKDLIDLPAQILPSVYLPTAALVEGLRGDWTKADSLWEDYKETGVIPALLSADIEEAARRAGEHPLFVALEAGGGVALAGRAAGAGARRAGLDIGDRERAPLELPDGIAPYERQPYSPDLIRATVQKAADRRRERREGGQRATPREVDRILNERADRLVAINEAVRRANRNDEAQGALESVSTGSRTPFRRRAPEVDQSGANLAVQGLLTDPDRFHLDLAERKRALDESHAQMAAEASRATTMRERLPLEERMEQNREQAALLDRLAREGDPEAIFKIARENSEALRNIDAELVELGLLDPRQAAQSRMMPAAVQHLDAQMGTDVGRLDRVDDFDLARDEAARLGSEERALGRREDTLRRRSERSQGRLTRLEAEATQAARRAADEPRRQREAERQAALRSLDRRITREQRVSDRTRGRLERLEVEARRSVERRFKTEEKRREAMEQAQRDPNSRLNRARQRLLDAEANIAAYRRERQELAEPIGRDPDEFAREYEKAVEAINRDPSKSVNRERKALLDIESALVAIRREREGVAARREDAEAVVSEGRPDLFEQLVDRDGNALPPERLAEMLRERGIDPDQFGFVSQSPSARGPKSFFRSFWGQRQTLAGQKRRTGKATEEGTFDTSFDAVAEQRIRGRGIIDAVKGFERTVQEFAIGNQRFRNFDEAREAARHPAAYGLPEDVAVVPVRVHPLQASARERQIAMARTIDEHRDISQQMKDGEAFVEMMMKEATREGDGPVVLMPKVAVDRLQEHLASASTTRRLAQVLSSQFKGVVLPTSPNWLAGNIIDVSMRSMLSGTIPWGRDAALGRRILRELDEIDPELGQRVRAGLAPGSMFGMADGTRVYRDARQFMGTWVAPFAQALGALRRTRGPKQITDAYIAYRDAVFHFNEKFIERQSQYAQIGRQARRDIRAQTGKWHSALKLGDDAIRDLAEGLRETPTQIRYAKAIEETLGKWTANSPGAREFLVDYAPFAMWARAATKFVLWTLPVHHPIKTGIAAALYEMTEDEREALGLSHFTDESLPPNLQGSIPLEGGGLLAPQTVTSFGFFADYQQSLASSILPQFPIAELMGLDFSGKRIVDSEGRPASPDSRAAAVFWATGEAFFPFIAQARRFADKGAEGIVPRTFRPYEAGLVDWLRQQSESRQISVPVSPSLGSSSGRSSSSGPDPSSVLGGGSASSSSAPDPMRVLGGGG